MTAIATLRATNCSRLFSIREGIVAACGSKTAYIIHYQADGELDRVTCTAPREAEVFVPWLAPAAPLHSVRAVWCVRKEGSNAIYAESSVPKAAPVQLVSEFTGTAKEMRIFYQSILAMATTSQVAFYFLDPAASAAGTRRVATVELPPWAELPSVHLNMWCIEGGPAATEKVICVACASPERLFVAMVDVFSPTTAMTLCRTEQNGVLYPSGGASNASHPTIVDMTVRWCRRELLLLTTGGAKNKTALLSFSLRAAPGKALSQWVSCDDVTASLKGATPAVLDAARSICGDSDGTHLWLCDTTSGPRVELREVAAGTQDEALVLSETKASARLTLASEASGLLVLSGCTLYLVRGGGGLLPQAQLRNLSQAAGPSTSAMGEPAPCMSDQLQQIQRSHLEGVDTVSTGPLISSETSPTTEKDYGLTTSVDASEYAATATTQKSNFSQVKDMVLHYATGVVKSLSVVVRDSVYVHEVASQTASTFSHDILDYIDEKFQSDRQRHAEALLRYATVAQSMHPYSVLRLFHVQRGPSTEEAVPGLLLALAFTLSKKATLQHGGLQRLPAFNAVSAVYFCATSHAESLFENDLERKRYAATLCSSASSALASGALGAAQLLFAVADRAVCLLYGGDHFRSGTRQRATAEELQHEATIAESIALMRSYVEWTLAASSSLGVISAHVGAPSQLTKEAALRDGLAHSIDTSRQVHIHAMQVSRLPKRSS